MLTTASSTSGLSPTYIIFGLLIFVELAFLSGIVYLFVLIVKALRKYIHSGEVRKETIAVRKTLGETLKEQRERCKMTQEFVAEHIGVSRQAVSKWETGASDPSTANLIALAKLFGVSPEELLKNLE